MLHGPPMCLLNVRNDRLAVRIPLEAIVYALDSVTHMVSHTPVSPASGLLCRTAALLPGGTVPTRAGTALVAAVKRVQKHELPGDACCVLQSGCCDGDERLQSMLGRVLQAVAWK